MELMKRGLAWLSFTIVVLCATAPKSQALAEDVPREYQLKAAYLHKFTKFMTASDLAGWPKSICIAGRSPFGDTLERLEELREDRQNKLEIRTVTEDSVADCSLVFIGKEEQHRLQKLLGAAAHYPVVTVSDVPGFAHQGGTIELIVREGRVRFVINNVVAKRHGIEISSRLLRLADEVITEGAT